MGTATQTTSADPQELWAEYHRTRSDAARNRLVEHYLPMVRETAEVLRYRLPDWASLDSDDLAADGIRGLMKAIDAYDPHRTPPVRFRTFAAIRVRGAMIDRLREYDWVPRLTRSRSRRVEKAKNTLRATLGRTPTDDELRHHLRATPEQYGKLAAAKTVTLHQMSVVITDPDDPGEEMERGKVLRDVRTPSPDEGLMSQHVIELMLAKPDSFRLTDCLVIRLHYFDGLTLQRVGEALELSESRVSQLRKAILSRLRTRFRRQLLGEEN